MEMFPFLTGRLSPSEKIEALLDLIFQEKWKGYCLLRRISALLDKIWETDPDFRLTMPANLSECFLLSGNRPDGTKHGFDSHVSEKLIETIAALNEAKGQLRRLSEEKEALTEEIEQLKNNQIPEGIGVEKALGMTMLTMTSQDGQKTVIAIHPAANLIKIYPPDQRGIEG